MFPLGAFIAGLVVPREGGLAIVITGKLEDMVAIIFLPLVIYGVGAQLQDNAILVFYILRSFD
jgi:Kef-type K+ transport system membrane component KefB